AIYRLFTHGYRCAVIARGRDLDLIKPIRHGFIVAVGTVPGDDMFTCAVATRHAAHHIAVGIHNLDLHVVGGTGERVGESGGPPHQGHLVTLHFGNLA